MHVWSSKRLVLGVNLGGGRTPVYIIPCYRCFLCPSALHPLLSLYLQFLQPHNLSVLLIKGLGSHCKIQLGFVALGGPLTVWFFLVPLYNAE